MTALMLAALVACLPDEPITYAASDCATPEELQKCAAAMAARCKAHGYRGVQTETVESDGLRGIRLSCETGFTPDMRSVLNAWAAMSGTSVEVRVQVRLSDVEREQFQAGRTPAEDKAPPGARWVRFRGGTETPVLLRETPAAAKGDIVLRNLKERAGGAPLQLWEISRERTREFREADRKEKLGGPVLVLDGFAVEALSITDQEKNEEGRWVPAERWTFTPSSRIVRMALSHPMPLALQTQD